MTSLTPTVVLLPTISAYRRIVAAGFEMKITQQRAGFRIKLLNGPEVLAHCDTVRMGALSAARALEKIRANSFGPTSSIYEAMQQLAEIAERYTVIAGA